jgi:hypothetical protein
MLGGAAKGTFARLDQDAATFELYYAALAGLIRERDLDGLDLDIEEPMSLDGVVRLIDRLKADFGDDFLVTLAPVAAALVSEEVIKDYAEFSYEALEVMRGDKIAWYNTQFYCGWGNIADTAHFDMIVIRGFPVEKIVVGLMTNPANGPGWVPFELLKIFFVNLKRKYPDFAGVMAWEYFNSLPGDRERPWEWAAWMTRNLVGEGFVPSYRRIKEQQKVMEKSEVVDTVTEVEGQLPKSEDCEDEEW